MFRKLMFKSAFWSYINTILAALIGIVTQPIMLNNFGKDKFGVWSLTLGLISYIGNSNIGIPTATTVSISESNDEERQKILYLNSFKLLIILSIIFLFIFTLIDIVSGGDWLRILGEFPSDYKQLARQTVIVSVILFLIKSPMQVAQASFLGHQEIDIAKKYDTINTMIPFLALIIIVKLKLDLIGLAYLIGIGYVFINLISFIHFIVKHNVRINFFKYIFSLKNIDMYDYKSLLKKGLGFFVTGIASMLIYNTDNFVISNMIGIASIPLYAMTYKLFTLLIQIFNVFVGIFFPMYGKAYAEKKYKFIQNIYDTATSLFSILAGGMWIGGILLTQEVINIWTGRLDMHVGLLLPFALGGFVYSLSTVNLHSSILSGINKNLPVIKLIWIEGIVNLVLSIIFAHIFGVGGVALGTFVASISVPFIWLPKYVEKETHGNIIYVFKNTKQLIFVLVPFLIVSIITSLRIMMESIFVKLVITLVILLIYFVLSYIVLDKDLKETINKNILRK